MVLRLRTKNVAIAKRNFETAVVRVTRKTVTRQPLVDDELERYG